MTTFPTVNDVLRELHHLQKRLSMPAFPTGEETCEIRLQVYENGNWAIRSGDSSYDLDHRGFWGASSISPSDNAESLKETAENLLEQVLSDAGLNEWE